MSTYWHKKTAKWHLSKIKQTHSKTYTSVCRKSCQANKSTSSWVSSAFWMYFMISSVSRSAALERASACSWTSECLEVGFGLRSGFVPCFGLGCKSGFVVAGTSERDLAGLGFSAGFDFIGLPLLTSCFDLGWSKNNSSKSSSKLKHVKQTERSQ